MFKNVARYMGILSIRLVHVLAAVALVMPFSPVYAAAQWNIKDLGVLPGGTFTMGTGINDTGQVVGYGDLVPQFNQLGERTDKPFAFISGPGGGPLKVLDTGPEDALLADFRPAAVNNAGRVVGTALRGSSFELTFVTRPNGVDLNYVTGDFSRSGLTNGVDINNSGTVLYQSSQGLSTPRVIKPDGTIINITGNNQDGFARGINASGEVALNLINNETGQISGYVWSEAEGLRPVRADNISSNAFDINSAGQVLARTFGSGAGTFIADAHGTSLHFLDLPEGSFVSDDHVIPRLNDAGQVIGELQKADGGSFAFVTEAHGGKLTDLETVPDIVNAGWSNIRVTAINNLGQIAGYGTINGATRAFLLSPVPEPEIYTLLLVGLGFMAYAQHSRKTQNNANAK